jgi:hypothetical protein
MSDRFWKALGLTLALAGPAVLWGAAQTHFFGQVTDTLSVQIATGWGTLAVGVLVVCGVVMLIGVRMARRILPEGTQSSVRFGVGIGLVLNLAARLLRAGSHRADF